jgi:hypothetical protein
MSPSAADWTLATCRRLRSVDDWIRLPLLSARRSGEALRACARLASEATETRVVVRCGGLQCEPGMGERVAEWARARRREVLLQLGEERLLACDESGARAPGRACGAVLGDGCVVHFSPRPAPAAVAAAFGLPLRGALGIVCAGSPDEAARLAACADSLQPRRWFPPARQAGRRQLHLPVYLSVTEQQRTPLLCE